MPAPSPLAIATSSVNRLLKEEASYHKEQKQQETRIKKLEEGGSEDQNADFQLKQEVCTGSRLGLAVIQADPRSASGARGD